MASRRRPSRPKRPKPVNAHQIRRAIRKSQLKVTAKGLEVKKPISMRGRTHWMEAEYPEITKTHTPQELLLASSVIARFRWKEKQKILRIWFVSGHVYDYFEVPESVVITLSQAQSKGHYFYYNIRKSFRYVRVK